MTPKKKTGLDMIKKYWWVIVFIFGVGVTYATLLSDVAKGAEKDKSQDKEIVELKQIAKGIHEISEQNAKILSELSGQLKVILTVLLPQASKSEISKWSKMPQEPKLDSFGNPAIGCEWLTISKDYLLATRYRVSSDSIEYSVEWDKRPAIE